MTHDDMLKKMGLTHDEHKDLLSKFSAFHGSLNDNQKKVMARSMPTLEQAAKSFGPGVTPQHLEAFAAPGDAGGGSGCSIALVSPSDG